MSNSRIILGLSRSPLKTIIYPPFSLKEKKVKEPFWAPLRADGDLFIEFKASDSDVEMCAVNQAVLILICLWWHRKKPTYLLLSAFENT